MQRESCSPQTLIIIANPTAGAGRGDRKRIVTLAARDLRRHGFKVQVCIEHSRAAVTARAAAAAREGIHVVMAAGGDGTVNAVVNGLMEAAVPVSAAAQETRQLSSATALGILPLGTGNVFAYNMGIPGYWRDACKVIYTGQPRRIDLGHASLQARGQLSPDSQRYFLLMAGIGFDAKVMEDTSLRLKYMLREFAYVLKSLQNAVTYRGSRITLSANGRKVYEGRAWLVMVGNAASYAWNIRFTARAKLDDGVLDVCLMPYVNKLMSVQQVLQLLMGQHIERGDAKYWQAPHLEVTSDPPVPVQLDGDEWAATPLHLKIHPAALTVLAPSPEPEE